MGRRLILVGIVRVAWADLRTGAGVRARTSARSRRRSGRCRSRTPLPGGGRATSSTSARPMTTPSRRRSRRSPGNGSAPVRSCVFPAPPGVSTATRGKRARTLAGWKGHVGACPTPTPRRSSAPTTACAASRSPLRMSKSDLRVRPIYHHLRQSIEAHPTSPKPSTTSTTTLNEPSRARRALRVPAPVAPTDRTVPRRKERHGGPPGQEDAQGLD